MNYVIGNYKTNQGIYYSVLWLYTGCRVLGFTSGKEASNYANRNIWKGL